MRVFAIGDLHLSLSNPKPMDVFGEQWRDHQSRIAESWDRLVGQDDLTLVPGDISWAMRLSEAGSDLDWLHERPGDKVIIRGNHDYWWESIGKVRRALKGSVSALQNDAIRMGQYIILGTRGWLLPGTTGFGADDERILRREELRLELSLQKADGMRRGASDMLVAMTHYPPMLPDREGTGLTDLMEKYGVRVCLYGHVHGVQRDSSADTDLNGIRYTLVSADSLGFRPKLVLEGDQLVD